MFLELGDLRVVHACWDPENINAIPDGLRFTREFLIKLHYPENIKIFNAIDECLKGREHKLPDGMKFLDGEGNERTHVRIRWYLDSRNINYEDYYLENIPELIGKKVETDTKTNKDYYYKEDELPVFFGHYWFKGNPKIESNNVACVDYSVAKGGRLVAYKWNGERELRNEGFVC